MCWYTIVFPHGCHSEDWPAITYAPQGVNLVPHNFMEWNPTATINDISGTINSWDGGKNVYKYTSATNGDLIATKI